MIKSITQYLTGIIRLYFHVSPEYLHEKISHLYCIKAEKKNIFYLARLYKVSEAKARVQYLIPEIYKS